MLASSNGILAGTVEGCKIRECQLDYNSCCVVYQFLKGVSTQHKHTFDKNVDRGIFYFYFIFNFRFLQEYRIVQVSIKTKHHVIRILSLKVAQKQTYGNIKKNLVISSYELQR